jgi:hypothetical protein
MSKKKKQAADESSEDQKFPLPIYKAGDDIYSREKEVSMQNEDNLEDVAPARDQEGPADDLDIPGTELDDADESIGEEDEENNYYSLGGDRHDDLEEDNE